MMHTFYSVNIYPFIYKISQLLHNDLLQYHLAAAVNSPMLVAPKIEHVRVQLSEYSNITFKHNKARQFGSLFAINLMQHCSLLHIDMKMHGQNNPSTSNMLALLIMKYH